MAPALLFGMMLVAWLGGCAAPPATTAPEAPPYEREAMRRFGPGASVAYEPNAPGTYMLVAHRPAPTPRQPQPLVSYFVFDLRAGRVAFEETAVVGRVGWDDDRFLRVERTPGAAPRPDGGDASYRVDVYTGRRVTDTG